MISNPRAGRGGARRALAVERFRELLGEHGVEVEVRNTERAGDATYLAKRAVHAGVGEVIVSGGDGTINEALQGLVGSGVRLAVWPAGTANVLARELRMPFDAAEVAHVCARGRTQRVSIGCAVAGHNGAKRYFMLMAGVGLDASVVQRVRPRLKRRVGEAAFWYAGLGHLAHWEPKEFHVEIEGEIYRATFAAVGKAPRYGGGLAITPRARLDAPEFEICLVDSQSRFRYLRLLSHAMRGGVPENAEKSVRFIRAARLRADGDAFVQADGELIGRLPMSFEVAPETIELVIP
ncbi:MAG TPA: diacylglycerol kinase family protein [Pyrinomonadaceae bacterium]